MKLKVTVTRDLEEDGIDQVLTLEEANVGDYVDDNLRFFLEAMRMIGYTYIETLSAHSGAGQSYSSDDIRSLP